MTFENNNPPSFYQLFKSVFLIAFFFFLPFNYALTYNIGFPLKISEIALCILLILEFKSITYYYSLFRSNYSKTLVALLVFTFISFLVNFIWDYPYLLDKQFARITPFLDSLLKQGYMLVIFFTFFLSEKFYREVKWLPNILFLGAALAGIYTWYLFVFSLLEKETFLLPGMDAWPQHGLYSFGHFIRSGTFKEGNYTGLFFLTTALIAWSERKFLVSVFLFFAVLPTVSSMAICCSLLFFSLLIFKELIVEKQYILLLFMGTAFFFLAFKLSSNEDFRALIVMKLKTERSVPNVRSSTWSGEDRLNTAKVSLQMGRDNILWGVGPANYYLHFNHYNQDPFYEITTAKKIPNNVYLEFFAELGMVNLLLFLVFLIQIFRKLMDTRFFPLKVGFFLTALYLLAFPTFSILFLWAFFGYICAKCNQI